MPNARPPTGAPDPAAVARALEAAQAGRLEQAEKIFRRLARNHPDRIELHLSLVAIARDAGRLEDALDFLASALALEPDRVDLHFQRGALLFQLGRLDEAVCAYQRAAALAPTLAEAHDNLAITLWRANRVEEASASFARYVELAPGSAQGQMNLAGTLHELGRLEEAIAAYTRALTIDPEHVDAHGSLGLALHQIGRNGGGERIARIAGEWRRRFPSNPWADHLGAALSGENAPDRASDDYLRGEFDACAEGFEKRLDELGYCAPRLLMEALSHELAPPAGLLQVIDIGCGTGWGGRHLRPFASRLVGLDLSPRMLDLARARNVYDELVTEEIGSYLGAHEATFDLVFAADVFCYAGRLDSVFAAVAGSLRAGGTFGFTVEEDLVGEEFRLNASGRYSHTSAYLRRIVGGAGLTILGLFNGQGRSEGTAKGDFTYLLARKA